MPDQMHLLVQLTLLQWWHRLTIRSHDPDYILMIWKWECRGCTFSRMYDRQFKPR